MNVHWLDEPEHHDYAAAESYLSLVLDARTAHAAAVALSSAAEVEHPAKDIIRASRLPLLDPENRHVAKDMRKIEDGKHLSPVLLVRGAADNNIPLLIADGYHRVCAAYWHDEDAVVKARIV